MKKLLAFVTLLCAIPMLAGEAAMAGSCAGDERVLNRLEIESILDDVAMVHSLDPDLLAAIAKAESGECYDAISPAGAVGLMQLMPATAREYGVENRFDPAQNALGAARFIDYLKRNRPEGRLTLPEILAAYNAGEAAVTRAGGIPHYRETEAYVRRVLWLYLLGHVPESERKREAAQLTPRPVKSPARHVQAKQSHSHRYEAGSDSEILEQMAEVRRARQSESSVAGQ